MIIDQGAIQDGLAATVAAKTPARRAAKAPVEAPAPAPAPAPPRTRRCRPWRSPRSPRGRRCPAPRRRPRRRRPRRSRRPGRPPRSRGAPAAAPAAFLKTCAEFAKELQALPRPLGETEVLAALARHSNASFAALCAAAPAMAGARADNPQKRLAQAPALGLALDPALRAGLAAAYTEVCKQGLEPRVFLHLADDMERALVAAHMEARPAPSAASRRRAMGPALPAAVPPLSAVPPPA